MKKLFVVLGAIFATIIIIVAVLGIILIPHWLGLNKEAKVYLTNNVPVIVDYWNPQNLFDRATPELVAAAKPQEVDKLYDMFRQLGALKHLDAPELGNIGSKAFSKEGTYTYGNYTIHADFEKGSATISIQLLYIGTSWKINSFHINSDVFLPNKTS